MFCSLSIIGDTVVVLNAPACFNTTRLVLDRLDWIRPKQDLNIPKYDRTVPASDTQEFHWFHLQSCMSQCAQLPLQVPHHLPHHPLRSLSPQLERDARGPVTSLNQHRSSPTASRLGSHTGSHSRFSGSSPSWPGKNKSTCSSSSSSFCSQKIKPYNLL